MTNVLVLLLGFKWKFPKVIENILFKQTIYIENSKGQFEAREYKQELIIAWNIYAVSLFGLLKLLLKTIKNCSKFELIWPSILNLVKRKHVIISIAVFTITIQKLSNFLFGAKWKYSLSYFFCSLLFCSLFFWGDFLNSFFHVDFFLFCNWGMRLGKNGSRYWSDKSHFI